jgi:hypothetical protein
MTAKGYVLVVGLLLVLVGCSSVEAEQKPDACALFAETVASVTDLTDQWVAAGSPDVHPLREQIKTALEAQPDRFAAAVAVASPDVRDELVAVEGASRILAGELVAGRKVSTRDGDTMGALLFAAGQACGTVTA